MAADPLQGNDFPNVTEEDWRALIARSIAVRGPDALAAHTDDGIPVGPLYGQRAGGTVAPGRPAGPWAIVQRVDLSDVAAASAQIREDLAGGADVIELVFELSPSARGAGLPPLSEEDLDRLLAAAGPDGCRLRVDAGEMTPDVAFRILNRRPGLELTFVFDPTATLAACGRLGRRFDEAVEYLGLAAAESRTTGAAIVADGRPWHSGGASEVQELAAVMSAYVACLGLLIAAGSEPRRAAERIGIVLAADSDQFLTIAKFRAVRLLIARVLEAAGIEPQPVRVHAETAWRMMSRRDPHVNILRTTTAAFAAGIGGADSVTVLPFTAASGVADAFARRLARNTQTILIAEANLARVADPAAGSGAVEALTAALAERAWQKFRAIEAAGGLLAVVRAGTLQREVAAMREARARRVRERSTELVGVTLYPDAGAPPSPVRSAGRTGEGPAAETAEALIATRLAEPFEED